MAILGCSIRRHITAYDSSKLALRQLSRLYRRDLSLLSSSASFSTSSTGVNSCKDGCPGSGEVGRPHGSHTGADSVKTASPELRALFLTAFSLVAALLVLDEHA